MMAQPPYDEKLAPFYLLHYTYGMDYTLQGLFTPGELVPVARVCGGAAAVLRWDTAVWHCGAEVLGAGRERSWKTERQRRRRVWVLKQRIWVQTRDLSTSGKVCWLVRPCQ
jgi:hypothetical protein